MDWSPATGALHAHGSNVISRSSSGVVSSPRMASNNSLTAVANAAGLSLRAVSSGIQMATTYRADSRLDTCALAVESDAFPS